MRLSAFSLLIVFNLYINDAAAQLPVTAPGGSGDSASFVRIIKADRLTVVRTDTQQENYILAGNVLLIQGTTFFYCDSAVKDESKNTVEAFGKIHINDKDSIHTYAQELLYLGNTGQATLKKKVRLTDGKGILTTDELRYDVNQKIGFYEKGGKLVNGSSVLTSRQGRYNAETRDAYFTEKVKLVDSSYTMTTDTLLYDVNLERATFVAPTKIENGKTRINTKSGFYDIRSGQAKFDKSPVIEDSAQFVSADDIQYNKHLGAGIAEGNVVYRDSSQGISIVAGYTEFNRTSGRLLATRKPVLIMKQDKDSLYVSGDTLYSTKEPSLSRLVQIEKKDSTTSKNRVRGNEADSLISDSKAITQYPLGKDSGEVVRTEIKTLVTADRIKNAEDIQNGKDSLSRARDSVQVFRAFRRVRIFSDSMQAVCDSLSYSTLDSVFRMYTDPVIWSRGSQVSGDTVFLFTQNQQPSEVHVMDKGFSASKSDESLFNQIRGNNLFAYFTEGVIDRIRAKGNAESLYYLQDDDSAYFGLNYAKADAINLYLINKELKRITWVNGVEGVTYPFRQIPDDKKALSGFNWQETRRPKSRLEIFSR